MRRELRTPDTHPATDVELLQLVSRRTRMSLRELCAELWPALRWRPLLQDEDSASERVRADGRTAAAQVRDRMQVLARRGCVRVTREDLEVDVEAAESYEPLQAAQLSAL